MVSLFGLAIVQGPVHTQCPGVWLAVTSSSLLSLLRCRVSWWTSFHVAWWKIRTSGPQHQNSSNTLSSELQPLTLPWLPSPPLLTTGAWGDNTTPWINCFGFHPFSVEAKLRSMYLYQLESVMFTVIFVHSDSMAWWMLDYWKQSLLNHVLQYFLVFIMFLVSACVDVCVRFHSKQKLFFMKTKVLWSIFLICIVAMWCHS